MLLPIGDVDLPSGKRCCTGSMGGGKYAACDTSSCPNNFGKMNMLCHNYGTPQFPRVKDADKPAGSNLCPYVESDKAICDVSFYNDINPESCRLNADSKVHCLGKVKCQSSGMEFPEGRKTISYGTDKEGLEKGYVESAMCNPEAEADGMGAGTDCFYMGTSDNFKVCGDKGISDEEEEELAEPPADKTFLPPTKGSGSGDPHFKTWTGDKYDYHGECDLVLVNNPTFMDGLGLRIHIRTTRVKYFSYIEKVAVMIGDDVLEFDNDVENFYLNGALAETNVKHHKTLLGGFIVRRDPKALSIRLHDNGSEDRHAGLVAKIDLHTRKNGFPAVIVDGGHTDVFRGSLGLLGDWETGKRLARDGVTELNGEDATDFALEWQVRDDEPLLFKDARFPQFPQTCTPPAPREATRLGFSNFEKEAEAACAHWKEDIEDCIFDVIATRDVLVAEEGHIVHLA